VPVKRVLSSLILVVLLLCGGIERAGAAATPLQKTASGSLDENPDKRTYFDPLLVVELHRDRELWGYDLGLGVDVGPNLYAYVNQNPWSKFDPLGLNGFGLVFGHGDQQELSRSVIGTVSNPRFQGGAKMTGGALGVLGSAGTLGGTGGLSTPLAGPALVASSLLFKDGLEQVMTGEQPTSLATNLEAAGVSPGDARLQQLAMEVALIGEGGLQISRAVSPAVSARGIRADAKFAQKNYGEQFSKTGQEIYSKLVGSEINTIDDLAAAIKSGAVKADDIPVEFITKGKNQIIVNTRTSEALKRADVDRSAWNAVDRTDDAVTMSRVNKNLRESGLDDSGATTVTSRVKETVEEN